MTNHPLLARTSLGFSLVAVSLYALTFCSSSGGCSTLSGGLVVREGWMQTTSRFQPGAPGPGLGGVTGGAQGGAQGGASGGGRDACSGDSATSTRSRKTRTRGTVTLLTKQHQRMIRQRYSSSHLLWCRWSRDCRTATRQASVAPVVEERGPEGTAGGSAATWAASSQRPEHQLPAPCAWTRSAAAPGGETRSIPECHSTSKGYTTYC